MKSSDLRKIIKEEIKNVLVEYIDDRGFPKDVKRTFEQMKLDNITTECEKIIDNINNKIESLNNNKFIDKDKSIRFWLAIRDGVKKINGDTRKSYSKINDYERKRLNRD